MKAAHENSMVPTSVVSVACVLIVCKDVASLKLHCGEAEKVFMVTLHGTLHLPQLSNVSPSG